MKRIALIMCLIGTMMFASCEKKENGQTTNLSTYGYVQNRQGTALQGIAIVTGVEGVSHNDTVYTDEKGYFYSRTNRIPYPVPVVTVSAIDFQGVYQPQTITPKYMFECGTEFVPEKDCAFPAEQILFVLTEATE